MTTAGSRVVGGPARFDRGAQHRRAMLAKVHIAKQQLGMTTDDYQQVVLRVTSRTSAGDCTQAELTALLREFERMGFSAKARPSGPRPADHPAAMKARAMWISLHLLGAIDDTSEKALEAMARRQLRVDRLQWANQALVYKLIEALKAIAERHGWAQSTEGLPVHAVPIVLKRRLVERLLAKLREADMIPADWAVERAAFDLGGVEFPGLMLATGSELDLAAQAFGRALRMAPGA